MNSGVQTVAVPVSAVKLCIEALEYTARFSYLDQERQLAEALKELLAAQPLNGVVNQP